MTEEMLNSVRAKPFIQNLSNDICCPFFDDNRNLHFLYQSSGEVMMVNELEKVERVHMTHGQPSGAVFDRDGTLYITDYAHGAVLAVHNDGGQSIVVGVYEDKPLKGPSTIINDAHGNLFFTDSGPFGETGLDRPIGSLFVITNSSSGQILKPISLESLAYPSGIATSPNGKFIYVAEQMTNRILRYFEKPAGVYNGSVFCQLSGGVGPCSIVCDKNGTLYVAQYDVADGAQEGRVFVISPTGQIQSNITVAGPELSGLAINGNYLYITERSTGCIYKVDL